MFEEEKDCSVLGAGLISILVEVLVPMISSVLYDGGFDVNDARK